MSIDPQQLRIDGIYPQKEPGCYMQRVKLAGGVISAEQADMVADLATRYASGIVHLTTRCSMELHQVREHDLREAGQRLAAVDLTSRGACGGAVRGITCNTSCAPDFPAIHALAQSLHRHFTNNPRFEELPKKFKI